MIEMTHMNDLVTIRITHDALLAVAELLDVFANTAESAAEKIGPGGPASCYEIRRADAALFCDLIKIWAEALPEEDADAAETVLKDV